MDALEIAMKMEQGGEIFHRELARNTNNPGFREIYTRLAEEEAAHYQHFKNIQHCRNK